MYPSFYPFDASTQTNSPISLKDSPDMKKPSEHSYLRVSGPEVLKFPKVTFALKQFDDSKKSSLDILMHKLNLSNDSDIIIEKGDQIDFSRFKGKLHIPSSRNFEFVKYHNPKS
jgi:hypothetical protein